MTFSAGQSGHVAEHNRLLTLGTLGYAQVTADQTGITADTDLTGLSKTVTVAAGRRIRISARVRAGSSVANDQVRLSIKEGATVLQLVDEPQLAASVGKGLATEVILTPSAGSHTYKVSMFRVSGTGSATMYAAATYPAFLLVEDIGV